MTYVTCLFLLLDKASYHKRLMMLRKSCNDCAFAKAYLIKP
ncbi:hypothetical protein JCM19294_1564 [Nonlabens tegetincola]|uniref:Uncharacterized protein n=1 Tax=Nonlabens tegetincola TaxID=323273 RepID=A0A090Q6X7_9FLAO|nr:hypothetical protein JCM19294_1564 [Nonlabens tegetincola]